MKKYFITSLLTGIIVGFIAGGPSPSSIPGAFFGAIQGLFVGSVLILLIKAYFTFFRKKETKLSAVFCHIVIVGCISVSLVYSFRPPASVVFKSRISRSIPESVDDIKAKRELGILDSSDYIRFTISQSDLEAIIESKGFERVDELSQAALPYIEIKWFDVENIDNPEYFRKETMMPENRSVISDVEYFIYDKNRQVAYYIHHNM